MRIAVAGGTGLVGRHVVTALREAAHEPVLLTRAHGVDVTTGAGLDAALVGVDTIIDVTNVTTMSRKRSTAFFEAACGQLMSSADRAGVRHLVALSVVGSDRVDLGYYYGKRRQEELVLNGPVPASVLRATQFHEFAEQFVNGGARPLAVVPRMLTQPVAAREVASGLVELATEPAVGLAPELAGPREEQMVDMVRRLRAVRAGRRAIVPLTLPGRAGDAMVNGSLLPGAGGVRGSQTFDQWLAEHAS